MSSEHDYGVYGQYEQHKLCCCGGVLQASWWNRNGLCDRLHQFCWCDFMHGVPNQLYDKVYGYGYERHRLRC